MLKIKESEIESLADSIVLGLWPNN